MKKALIIVRDDWLRSTLADWLERDGFEPIAAWDSFIGLQIAQSQQPELMLCDVDMPDLNPAMLLMPLPWALTDFCSSRRNWRICCR